MMVPKDGMGESSMMAHTPETPPLVQEECAEINGRVIGTLLIGKRDSSASPHSNQALDGDSPYEWKVHQKGMALTDKIRFVGKRIRHAWIEEDGSKRWYGGKVLRA